MPLPSFLANQLHILESEHRSLLAISAPAFHGNVSHALTLIDMCVVPTPAIRAGLAAIRDHALRIRMLVNDPAALARDLEAGRAMGLARIDVLRRSLAGAAPSVGAQLALRKE